MKMENLEGKTKHIKEHCTSVEEAPRGGGIYYPVKVLSKKVPILRRALRNFVEWLAPTDDLNKANELRERIIEKYSLGAKDVVFYGVECSGGCFGKP